MVVCFCDDPVTSRKRGSSEARALFLTTGLKAPLQGLDHTQQRVGRKRPRTRQDKLFDRVESWETFADLQETVSASAIGVKLELSAALSRLVNCSPAFTEDQDRCEKDQYLDD